jgi:hypothetical protein
MYNLMVMKIQILKIEPFDNLYSLLDRIANTDSGRFVLAAESLPDWLKNPVSIGLIGRRAYREGKKTGIILQDSSLKSVFEQNGIQVFDDETSALHDQWLDLSAVKYRKDSTLKHSRLSGRPEIPQPVVISKGGKAVMAGITLVILLAILALVLPSARVTITMKRVSTPLELPVQVSPVYPAVTLIGSIPATVQTFNVSQVSTIPVTGQVLFAKNFARGEVVFTNLTDQEQYIPAGIQVSTTDDDPVFFVTEAEARLEGKSGAELPVRIIAQTRGEAGNTPPGTITRINSIQGSQLTVRNDIPTTGGSAEMVDAASPVDRNTIRAKVLEELMRRTLDQARSSLQQGELLIPESYRVAEIQSEVYFPDIGQPGTTISLQMDASTQVLVVRESDLAEHFNQVAGLGLPGRYREIPVKGSDLSLSCRKSGRVDQLTCTLTGTRQITVAPTEEEILSLVWGRSQSQAEQSLLTAYPDIDQIRISQNLPGWPWLPFLPDRLNVELQ